MDMRRNMIIAKGKPITANVEECRYNEKTQQWELLFKNGKTYYYSKQNVTCLSKPQRIDPQKVQIKHGAKIFDNIQEILSFSTQDEEYWHVVFSSGYEHDYIRQELQIEENALKSDEAQAVFDYLKEAAEQASVRAEDNTAVLSGQYEKIEFLSKDSAAACYLVPTDYQADTDNQANGLIFPFGCNESQFKAVVNALSNRVSVIEGPPGTGKTQTILNIIANLLVQGKTVQVVSNNNSAIDNIQEKLSSSRYQMGFFVALLGKNQRKEEFLQSQTGSVPDIGGWSDPDCKTEEFWEKLQALSAELQDVFDSKNRLAGLYQEKNALKVEWQHYDAFLQGHALEEQLFGKRMTSEKLMRFWQEYLDLQESGRRAGFFYYLRCRFSYGINVWKLFKKSPVQVLEQLHKMYYEEKLKELDGSIERLEKKLAGVDADLLLDEFTKMSLRYFCFKLAERYGRRTNRPIFSKEDLWRNPKEFLKEYPVVLSTTYTARSSLGKNARFDYVIMDEASQVDVATGFLALSCAANAVIVGDTKQLPNVVTAAQKQELSKIFEKYKISDAYDFTRNSFLQSICTVLGNCIQRVVLREHYRCHPLIIGFCNQKFYHGELLVMTADHGEKPLQLILTAAGHHEREHINQRQIDVIKNEILPKLAETKEEIGIIAPYRNQVSEMKREVGDSRIDIATVHKFQGREKDVIILSTVDDIVTSFSDDPNLLNVAVSRAKKKLIVVASEMEQSIGSNIGDLIGYIHYQNCEVQYSAIRSVFDYLYKEYREERLDYLKQHGRVSEYDSENLMYQLICEVLSQHSDWSLDVVCHQPLYLLIRDMSKLSKEEALFVANGLSHLDFLIYDRVSKRPILAVEVDGYQYHKQGTRQAERDKLKNHILELYRIPLIRFATNGSGEKEKLSSALNKIMVSGSVQN